MTNANLYAYKLPSAAEAPEIDAVFADSIDLQQNNLGVKGIGEPPMISCAAAVANAVFNAAGVRIRNLPITPDKVLTALGKGGQS